MPSKRFLLSLLMIVGVSAQDLVPDGKLPAVRTGVFKVPVKSSRITKVDEPILEAELHFYSDNTIRLTIDENSKLVENGRKRILNYSHMATCSTATTHRQGTRSLDSLPISCWVPSQARKSTFDLGDSTMLQLDHDTVVLALIVDGRVVQTLNEKQMFEVESTRKNYGDICPFGIQQSPDLYLDPACTPEAHPGTWAEEYRGLTDYKPHGPSSVALDITFHGRVPALYGLPEKGTRSLKLKIDGDDDHKLYRFFNLGYAAYSVDSGTSALYGTIPTLTALQVFNESEPPVRTSMLWVNPSDTYIALDRNSDKPARHTGYRQDYTDLHIPVDVFWLDIEHTNGKQYFTWNQTLFPDPLGMVQKVNSLGKEMVTIVDPHLKATRSYPIYLDGFCKDVYVKERYFCNLDTCDEPVSNLGGSLRGAEEADTSQVAVGCNSYMDEVFKGICWPGISAWPDFTSPRVREWWAKLFKPDGVNEYFYTWNDMNEPAVFEAMEMTMNRDLVHAGDIEHRDVHNAYGHYFRMATFEGHLNYRRPGKRPFILTRSFYLGSHRFGPMWNGDSLSQWDNLQAVLPMFITLSAPGGYSFTGSDVGGFTGQPLPELLTRWNQLAAATSVFYRLHSDIISPPRDPWLYDSRTLERFRGAVRDRYQLLPFWYTLFARYSMFGEPMLRPLWFDHMADPNTFDASDEYDEALNQEVILGTDILVRGVTEEGVASVDVYFPAGTKWYDDEHKLITGGALRTVTVTLDKIPRFYRAGSIIPRKVRVRDSTKGSENDPLTLWINEDSDSNAAEGFVYLDDGSSYNSTSSGQYALYKIRFNRPNITVYRESGSGDFPLIVERIKILSPIEGPEDTTQTALVTIKVSPAITVNFEEMSFRVEGSRCVVHHSHRSCWFPRPAFPQKT
ncbi:hypothetical protein FOZ62_011579 [Perkinsus olseni]|uniref:Neutral alpha-glucosidase AB n=1 Tax=Perkinsus olseni TaxID=32597 RepID=A0A7J6TEV5_PEROL|nr:hypothetical protein FOZ62_011579 [Perkinsus olseni]